MDGRTHDLTQAGLMLKKALGTALCATALLSGMVATAADTLIHNISGHTSTAGGIRDFSVLVFDDDGRVVAIGDSNLQKRYPEARHIDGRGHFVLPGLIDAHAHLSSQGFLQTSLDLAGTPSLADAVERIAEWAAAHPRARFITGRGWNQVLWEGKAFPTAADIDRRVADRPVWLRRIDGHAGWANSRMLELAGIDDDTPDPAGGRILRDSNGKATGVLIDLAMDIVDARIPPPEKDEIRAAYLAAVESLTALGLTGVHDAGISIREAEVLIGMADNGELDMRVYAMLSDAEENLDALEEPLVAYGDDRLDIRSVKLYADGALGSRGAALIEPYSDDPENRGLAFLDTATLEAKVRKANEKGFQVGIHAIGDLGNRQSLDVFELVQHGKPSPLRNRIEHAQVIAPRDLPRFAELGIVAAMQPIHATSDMNMAEDRVGPERIRGAYAWRSLLASGAVIAGGSDFPVELPNPFLGLYAAVTREDRDGRPDGGWFPEEAMSRAEALHAFTLAAAWAAHQETRTGSLEPGKWADFIIVDRDYFEVPASAIDDVRVLETWVGGEKVYPAGDP
jgi:predicted amidohydrolase YtcJ